MSDDSSVAMRCVGAQVFADFFVDYEIRETVNADCLEVIFEAKEPETCAFEPIAFKIPGSEEVKFYAAGCWSLSIYAGPATRESRINR